MVAHVQHAADTPDKFTPDKIKSTIWFYGYQTRVKACVMTECQSFNGVLQIVRKTATATYLLPTYLLPTTQSTRVCVCMLRVVARCC